MATEPTRETAHTPAARAALAILLTVVGSLALAAMDGVAKHLTQHLPVLQVIWARFLGHMVIVALVLGLLDRRLSFVAARRPGLQIARAAALLSANLMMYSALVHVPLADATAVQFFAPVLVTLLAGLVLGERVGAVRGGAVLAGFIGVLVIVRPGFSSDPHLLLPVGAAVFIALYLLLTRVLAGGDEARTTLFYTTLVGAVVMSAVMPLVWTPPAAQDWPLMGALGVLGAFGHLCVVLGMRFAPASLVAPFLYTQLLGAAVLSVLVFGDPPTLWLVAGGAILVASGLVVSLRSRPD